MLFSTPMRLMVIVTLLVVCSAEKTVFCALFFANGSSGGLVYLARREGLQLAVSRLRHDYPDIRVVSHLNQRNVRNMTAGVARIIVEDRCSAVMIMNDKLAMNIPGGLDTIGRMFPQVHFWMLLEQEPSFLPSNLSNVYTSSVDITTSYFQLGAAAAVECSSCVALLVSRRLQLGQASAMWRGMKFGQEFRRDGANVSEKCPLLVFFLATNDPPAVSATAFATMMYRRGCSVIATPGGATVNDRVSQKFTSTNSKGQEHQATFSPFLIVSGSDGVFYIGDNVLTSQVTDYEKIFLKFMKSIVTNTSFVSGLVRNVTRVGSMSTLASGRVSVAIAAADAAVIAGDGSVVWCPAMYNQQGTLVNPVVNGTVQCIPPVVYSTMTFVELGPVQFPEFRGPTLCPAGTWANYSHLTDLALTCVPCEAGSYSPSPGALACVACPDGQVPVANRSTCALPPPLFPVESDHEVRMTVALPILTVVVVLLAAIVVLLVRRVSNKSSHVLKCPPGFLHPAGSEKAFCMIAVDPVRSSKRWAEEAMVGAQKFEALQRAVEVATSQHNAIVVLSIPSKYYIAAETLLQAVEVAECAEQVMAADNAKNSAGCFIATHAIVTYGHLRVFKKQLDAENVRFGVGGQAANQLKKISGGLATSAQPVWGGICVPLAQFEALCERDPEISKRLVEMRHVMPQDASPPAAHDASSCEALRVAIIAHRCGEQQPTHSTHQQPPPAAAQASSADTLAVAAAPHTPAPLLAPTLPPLTSLPRHARQQCQHRDRGETDVTVLTERQYNALMQMFETIALRIVMCIPPAEQKAVALRLRQRLRIFLHDQLPPRAAVALTAARASHRHQSSSSSTSFDTVKDWELRQILPISTVMTLESMDELGLWEQVKDITR